MNQQLYEATGAGLSQADRILAKLREAAGGWVQMPQLVQASGAYAVHSRIADLRKRGLRIEQESVNRGRLVFSFYRLQE